VQLSHPDLAAALEELRPRHAALSRAVETAVGLFNGYTSALQAPDMAAEHECMARFFGAPDLLREYAAALGGQAAAARAARGD
jgi:hypothetical protein